jgi:hypothetical protein
MNLPKHRWGFLLERELLVNQVSHSRIDWRRVVFEQTKK